MSAPVPPEEPPAPDRVRPPRRTGGALGAALTGASAAALLALWFVTVAGRSWSAPPAVFVALVMLLPYLYVAYAAVVFGLWIALPDRRALPLLLGAGALTALGLWGPSWPARGEAAAGEPLRVMTWNVRRLWGGPDDGGSPPACVIAGVEQAAPDVLTLLEVSRADVDALSAALDLVCVHTTYRGTEERRRGGLAACVRGDRWQLKAGSAQRFVDDEDWHYVFTEVERSGSVVNLLSVHLYPYAITEQRMRDGLTRLVRGTPDTLVDLSRTGERVNRAQGNQTAALVGRVERLADPTIVAGDFNSTRDAAFHVELRRHLADTWERGGQGIGGTVLLSRLPLRVDYVYASERFAVVGAKVPAAGCSDHRPVVSDLVLRDPMAVPSWPIGR